MRLGVFPEEWFQAFYPKTGVTGPYMALFGFSTFLASKEYFVMEHDFYVGVALAIVLGAFIKVQWHTVHRRIFLYFYLLLFFSL